MDAIYAYEVEVGMTVINALSGSKYKVGKVEKKDDGRIAISDNKGEVRNVSGKKVQYYVVP